MRTVCLIHSHLGPAFSRLGCRVVSLTPPDGVASLPELLAALSEPPDCVIHQENLGRLVVLADCGDAPCPVLYWSLDTHLNHFWQRHYVRALSAAATTQPHLTTTLSQDGGPRCDWVPWHGQPRTLAPPAQRTVPLAFVGRVSAQRQRRQWFVEHLTRFGLLARQDISGAELAAFYDTVRAAPNECIAGEVNLRLFEAASSGCLPVSERTPAGVETLFAPDREALYYDDVAELDDRLRFLEAHPDLAATMGRAAHAAVAARHLPDHRAKALLDLARDAPPPPKGPAPDAALALTLYHLNRCGQLATPRFELWRRLAAAPGTPEIMAARIQLALADNNRDMAQALFAACLSHPALAGDARSAAACALAALRLGQGEAAKRAYVAFVAAAGRREAPRLHAPRDYLLFFANALEAVGCTSAPGMLFDHAVHLPETAVQCLVAAKALDQGDLEIERRLETLLRRQPGSEAERIGLLSNLSLHRPDDWTLCLELGLANLKGFRLEAGLEELRLAAATAARTGQDARFARRLSLVDPSGRVRRLLGMGWEEKRPPAAGGDHPPRTP